MKLEYRKIKLKLRHTFRIARSADDFRYSVITRLKIHDIEGFGEATPSERYGQSVESVEEALSRIKPRHLKSVDYIEDSLEELSSILGDQRAALAAIDLALFDILGKRVNTPLYTLLGLNPAKTPVTSYTIGIDTAEVIKEKVLEAKRFPVLKIKMGLENDYEIMETIRKVTDKPVRIDANEGWSKEEAYEKIKWLEDKGVQFIEQPLPADRIEDTRWLKERVKLPLFADESVQTSSDIPGLIGAFDGINIKLMKSGGIREALRMIHTARACGMKIMLGCMIESSIGITAAAHLSPLVDYADLDGNLLITN
ncbi:MAG: dipeptide epimerase, partial [Candidatus Latescibacteria bacterium 4484_7]